MLSLSSKKGHWLSPLDTTFSVHRCLVRRLFWSRWCRKIPLFEDQMLLLWCIFSEAAPWYAHGHGVADVPVAKNLVGP